MKRRTLLARVGVSTVAVAIGSLSFDSIAEARRIAHRPIEGRLRAGELLSLHVRREPAETAIDFDREARLPVGPTGRVVFAAPRDAPGQHRLRIGRATETLSLAERAHPQRSVHVPEVEGMPAHTEALRAITRVRRVVRDQSSFETGFAWPIDAEVTSEFAAVRPHGVHLGIDLLAAEGSRVRAPADGVVVMHIETPVFGRTIVIDHGHGLTSSLLHLTRALAPEGAVVRRGQVVALSGATGRVTGPHLDWRVAWRDVDVDPRGVIALLPPAT